MSKPAAGRPKSPLALIGRRNHQRPAGFAQEQLVCPFGGTTYNAGRDEGTRTDDQVFFVFQLHVGTMEHDRRERPGVIVRTSLIG